MQRLKITTKNTTQLPLTTSDRVPEVIF